MATLRVRIGRYLLQQAPRRVFWAVLTGLTGLLIGFVQQQFNGSDIDSLAAQYATTDVDPAQLIKTWPPARRWLAGLGLGVDTVLFIPAYALTLAVWCRFFALHSLFVTNQFRPHLKHLMQWASKWIVRLLLVSVFADLVENTSMGLWLGWTVNIWPSGGWMTAVRVLKFTPVGLAVFYILLHPLGVVLSFRESLFRFIGLDWYSQEQVRTRMMDHIISSRSADLDIRHAVRRYKKEGAFATPPPLSAGRYIITIWKGFLNVQFIVYLLLLMGGLFQLDQFDELFYFLLTEWRGVWVVFFTMLALCAWSGMIYVCSKILLFIQPNYFDGVDADKVDSTARALDKIDGELAMLRNTPLWLSQAPFWLMFLTLILNFRRLAVLEQRTPDFRLKYAAILLLLSLFYVAFWLAIHRVHNFNDRPDRPERRWSFALFKPDTPANDYALLVDRVPYSILYGQGVLVLLFLLFLPTATGLMLAQGIGLYAIVMLWLTGFAYMGTLLYQFNQLPKYPVLVVLVIAVLLFSQVNDNSDVRQSPVSLSALPGQPDSLVARRPGLDAYYTHWLQTRLALDTAVTDTLPVVVIATAGGGIRAAAWTTSVLNELNTRIPRFDRYLFAISGVSGGGVGAATYLAAVGGKDTVTTGRPVRVSSYAQLAPRISRVVTEDLISPIAASMLFRGGIHNFTPFRLPDLDRNRWLEDAWERQMLTKENMPNDSLRGLLSESFLSLWPDSIRLKNAPLDLPALLLNGAVAETGQKIVMSNLALGNTTDQKNSFYDVADFFTSTGHDVPYKTATFLCARFPFVTSGGKANGTLPNILANCGKNEYHIIDGGYAENTGIVTAVQLIKKLQIISNRLRTNKAHLLRRPVAYYLLFLPNYAASQEEGSVTTFRFLSEPVNGLLNTWNRNGVSLDQLIGRTLQGSNNELSFSYASLTLDTRKHRYPLGWYISHTAYETMTTQANRTLTDSLQRPGSLFNQLKRQIEQAKSYSLSGSKTGPLSARLKRVNP